MEARRIRYFLGGIVFAFLIFGLFGPFLIYNSTSLTAIDAFVECSKGNIGYFLLLLLPFILTLSFSVVSFALRSDKASPYPLFILSLFAGVLYLFCNLFYANGLGVDPDLVFNGNLSIILGVGLIVISLYFVSKIFEQNQFTINDIVEIAVFVSLAIVLDLSIFEIKVVANGGSISLMMVPLVLISLRKGFVKGFIACGVVFGLLSCLIDGYGFITYPLDYLLGFGSMALVGLFRPLIMNKEAKITVKGVLFLLLAIIVACIGRTAASTISGIVIYETPFVESLIYQLTYMGPSMILLIVLSLLLYRPIMLMDIKYSKKVQ